MTCQRPTQFTSFKPIFYKQKLCSLISDSYKEKYCIVVGFFIVLCKSSCHLMSAYYVPGSVYLRYCLQSCQKSPRWVLQFSFYSWSSERFHNFFMVTQSGMKTGISSKSILFPLWYHDFPLCKKNNLKMYSSSSKI